MKSKKFFIFLALVLVLSLALGACNNSDKKLKEVADEANAQLESTREAMSSIYSDISIKADSGKLIYSYTYADTMSDEEVTATKDALEDQSASFSSMSSSLVTQLNSAGVKDAAIVFEFYNGDGSLIYSQEIK